MIRTRIAAALVSILLAIPGLQAAGTGVHAAGSNLTGLWFDYAPTASIYSLDVTTRCVSSTKTCLQLATFVQMYDPAGNTAGPLQATPVPGTGAISVALPPPCIHTFNSPVCMPVTTSKSITFTPNGQTLWADIVTRNGLLVSHKSEFLCRCLPG